jgi:hypothetical protein
LGAAAGRTFFKPSPRANDDPYADELWETACYEGNTESLRSIHSLGYKWFTGVTPSM